VREGVPAVPAVDVSSHQQPVRSRNLPAAPGHLPERGFVCAAPQDSVESLGNPPMRNPVLLRR
jgi:hypothetical protein